MTDSFAYWRQRAARHGPRAVFNLTHPPTSLDDVTDRQWAVLEPSLRQMLRGDEAQIVDFGCGTGRMTRRLAMLTSAQVVGVDPTLELIEHARVHTTDAAANTGNVRFRHAPHGLVPLGDASADGVLIHLVLGGLRGDTLHQAVGEVTRVLRPGGWLMLVENTEARDDLEHWAYRSVDCYRACFPGVSLEPVAGYDDAGERITVLVGRRQTITRERVA